MSENFNVSLPWAQVKCVKIRESKFGTAFVVETSEFSGGYVLGFKVNEVEEAFGQIVKTFTEYLKDPYFGVECVYEDADAPKKGPEVIQFKADIVEVVQTGYEENVAAQRQRYQIGSVRQKNMEKVEIEYNEDLGLACEKLPAGLSIDHLWKIV